MRARTCWIFSVLSKENHGYGLWSLVHPSKIQQDDFNETFESNFTIRGFNL